MANTVAQALHQEKPFSSSEQEILLGLRIAVARIMEPWAEFLKTSAQLTPNQYNVLRILRGAHPGRLASSQIGERMISRDPDITRLVDRLAKRSLVERLRSDSDRRVVEVSITAKGRKVVSDLDIHVRRMPKALLGHLGPARLRQLGVLLDAVIAKMGTFP